MDHLIDRYLDQFVKTATKGNVDVQWAVHADRVQFYCKRCDTTLTSKIPEGTSIDYSIQEFVKIHAHVGGHRDHVHDWHYVFDDTWGCTCGQTKAALAPTAVTADFKKVPIGSGFHVENINPMTGELQKLMNSKSILETNKNPDDSPPPGSRGPRAKKLSQPTGRKFR